ncbi:hypothetical protein COO60DRAFT_1464035 [Scenedesmus sp. NREL 46B-D3]|nr:hypothetical protein COO60DRAFT_1464035 [Scenedesmus sp. NREL 46B-D3]
MGERKVLNKYYPPDFDPAKLPRGKRQQNNEMKVRMMLPMSVRCKTCGNFMYKGTKFNTRKEDADVLKAEAVRSREEEERGNAMKALENRTKDSKREMDIMEALDEMRSLKARHAGITTENALAALQREGAGIGSGSDEDSEPGGAAASSSSRPLWVLLLLVTMMSYLRRTG